jgi:hypothetical protein
LALSMVDLDFAKQQLQLMLRERYLHPNGQMPAYEWNFSDVNPPVHAWAALNVYRIDGGRDHDFLERIFHKLLINFTWWVNRQDAEGNNLFEGGFLGLDNIGPFDRSHMPVSGVLEQSDGTGWMGFYALAMLRMAVELSRTNPTYDVMITKFLEHFVDIARAVNQQGLWDEKDGFYYDHLSTPDGHVVVMRYPSIVGVMPVLAGVEVGMGQAMDLASLRKRFAAFAERRRGERIGMDQVGHASLTPEGDTMFLSLMGDEQLRSLLREVLDESSLLSPFGLRALSRRLRDRPFAVDVDGVSATVDYEPAESTTGLFGGNSNWRGPIWFPVNYLVIEALERHAHARSADFRVECPVGSGRMLTLSEVAEELRRRLISIFLPGPDGRRPVHGGVERFATDPEWKDLVFFHEYFHGDDGAGLGATHQTGWTGLVADLISARRHRAGSRADRPGPS